MHLQIRTEPALSPANLLALLEVLEREDINIEAAGGSNVEQGGEFAFAVAHDEEERAMAALIDAGYHPRLVEVDSCALSNEPGQLRSCIAKVAEANERTGRVIRDISVGVADADGRVQVQIYSE